MYNCLRVLVSLFLVIGLASCSKDDGIKSNHKQIEKFSVQVQSELVNGLINEKDFTVSLLVPYSTDVTALAPEIAVSKHASVIPGSEKTQDFTKPVNYTVIAEDGSKQVYVVTVTKDAIKNADILSFDFNALVPEVKGTLDQEASTVVLAVPNNADIAKLIPTITLSEGASIVPASGTEQDFTKSVTYTVSNAEGDKRTYEVSVTTYEVINADILSFEFKELKPAVNGTIDQKNKTVNLTVPYGTDVTKLKPSFTISEGASVTPASDKVMDYTKVVNYSVTNTDGDINVYKVKVTIGKNTAKKILSFTLDQYSPPIEARVNETDFTITATIPWYKPHDIYDLKPNIVISEKATVDPESGVQQRFDNAVTYTVTAENGDMQAYTVNILVEDAPPATVNPVSDKTIYFGGQLTITGTNISECELYIKADGKDRLVSWGITTGTESATFNIYENRGISAGRVDLFVKVRGVVFELGNFNVKYAAPIIEVASDVSNQDVAVYGSDFRIGQTQVFFVKDGVEYPAMIIAQVVDYRIIVNNPYNIPAGEYHVRVQTPYGSATSIKTVTCHNYQGPNLYIAGVNKKGVKLGEKLIIYGKNFQKVGVKNIAFRLWNQTEEIKLVGKVVNDGQYEVIIPTTFAATIYRIRLYGNDNSSTASNFQVPIQK